MIVVEVSKLRLLEVLIKYDMQIDDRVFEEVGDLLESIGSLKLTRPLSSSLKAEINSKLISLKNTWISVRYTSSARSFRSELGRSVYKVNIGACNVAESTLEDQYLDSKMEIEQANADKMYLAQTVDYLNRELTKLKKRLAAVDPTSAADQPCTSAQVDEPRPSQIIPTEALHCETRKIKDILEADYNPPQIQIDPEALDDDDAADKNSKFDYAKSIALTNKIMMSARLQGFKHFNNDPLRKAGQFGATLGRALKHSRRKSYYEVTVRQQTRIKRQIKEALLEGTQFLRNLGLCLSTVEINPIELDDCDFKLKIRPSTSEANAEQHEPNVNNLLYFKDKHSISDRAYFELKSKCFLNIPSMFHLKKRRGQIDSMFAVHENEMGVFFSFADKLKWRLESYFERKYGFNYDVNAPTFRDDIIHVKLSADGTNIGRTLKLLNFTFTIINEGAKAKTANGNYTLGIYEIEHENYASVIACYGEIIDEVERLNEIEIKGKKLHLVYYHAGDWKMLANSLGILAANSKYPCVWCKCAKEEFYRTDVDWSIMDPKQGARSHEEQADILLNVTTTKANRYGYDRPPIFRDIIPIHRYMIDMLHLFLRISDTLFNLLVKDCSLADNFDPQTISKFEIGKYKHMNSLQHFLNERCNVKFTFLWTSETKKLTWRDLMGPDKARLFENFNLAEIMPDHDKFEAVTNVWKSFYDILNKVKAIELEADQVKERTRQWLKLFLTVYSKTTVTPYMHAFVAHLHEFVHLYKDINAFNCQGLEKLNDISTTQYFKSTNKRDTALHQMLKKRNRMEYLADFLVEIEDKNDDQD